jgi:trigger factor
VNTQVKPVAENQVELEVEVPQDEVDRQFDRTLTRVAREAQLPGFRKGRVPKQMVLQRFGEDYVLGETLQDALPDWYESALTEADVDAVSQPELDMGDLQRGAPFTFKATVQVKPTPSLGAYKGVSAPRREVSVPEDQVTAQLAMLQERFASLRPVEDRAVQTGDFVSMDFVGRTEDGPLDGASGSDYVLQVGSGRLVPGFEENLVDMAAGEEKEFTVTFPDDYGVNPATEAADAAEDEAGAESAEDTATARLAALRGAPVTFSVNVKEIKEKVVPELSDEFAKDVSEFETLDELRADVRQRMVTMQEQAAEREFRAGVVEAVAEAADVAIPTAMVDREAHGLYHELEEAVGEQNLTMDVYLSMIEKTPEIVEGELRPRAEANVRRRLVLEAVAEAEGLEVTDDEIRERIIADAEMIGRDGTQLVLDVWKSGRQDVIRDELLMAKTVDMLVENAVATEMPADAPAADEPDGDEI